jgi:hypothetical protein
MALPLSTDEWILTTLVVDGAVDPEPVAIAIRHIISISPCGEDPGWCDVEIVKGGVIEELTIATPFGELIPTAPE